MLQSNPLQDPWGHELYSLLLPALGRAGWSVYSGGVLLDVIAFRFDHTNGHAHRIRFHDSHLRTVGDIGASVSTPRQTLLINHHESLRIKIAESDSISTVELLI